MSRPILIHWNITAVNKIKLIFFSGQLSKLNVRHDNSGFRPNWFLERIEVVNTMTKEVTVFPCSKWLDKSGDISRDLYPKDL